MEAQNFTFARANFIRVQRASLNFDLPFFRMYITQVPKNNHAAKFQDQQNKGVDATEPQSWSKSQKTRFFVIFAIFDGFGHGCTSAYFRILTSNLTYYTS